jgi:hypothetical protein
MRRRLPHPARAKMFFALLLTGGLCAGRSLVCTADPAPADVTTADDGLVALLLDASADRRTALEEAVGTRGAGGMEALARARHGPDAQRAWLAEAFATRLATGASDLPEMRAAFDRATRVLRVFSGSAPGDDPRDPERAAARRADDALAMLAEGEPRALPWVAHFADRKDAPDGQRLACARALVAKKIPHAIGRLERVLEECPGAYRPYEMVDEIAATGSPEAVPLLLRARALATSIGDGRTTPLAQKALERLRGTPGFLEAYAPWFVLVRRFEAEEAPLKHSTGAVVDGGWQAKAGRDQVEHMVYGPYVTDLPREELVARFRYRIDAAAEKAAQPLLALEVMSEQMQRHHWPVQTVSVGSKSAVPGEWREIDIDFWPHPAPAEMEFRVRWNGSCDATVDRIDILRVRARTDADRALDPPRAEPPWSAVPIANPAPTLSLDVARALFDAAFALATAPPRGPSAAPPASPNSVPQPLPRPGAWQTLRDLLLADASAPNVLAAAANEHEHPDRAWLADAWRVRLEHRADWDELAHPLDVAFAWLLHSTPSGHILGGVTPRAYEDELSQGSVALAITGVTPPSLPKGFAWAHDLPDRGFWHVDRPALGPLPQSDLWRAIFAEVWLAGPRGPLSSAGWNVPASPRRTRIPVVPCATGVFRLHALTQLAWLREARVRPALVALLADSSATADERAVASRLLAGLPK